MSVEQGSGGDGRSAGVAARQHARAWLAGALTWRFLETVMPAPLVGYVAAAAGVALVSALIGVILAWRSVGNLPMLYLVVVLATAIRFGRGPAVMASIAAFLTFEWFFIAPAHTLTVGDPQEWIALLLLLVVSVVTGQLAAGQRQRANEAQRREREARALYALGRILNAQDDLSAALTAVAEHLRRELDLAGCAILLPERAAQGGRVVARAMAGEAPPADERLSADWIAPPARPDGTNGAAGAASGAQRWVRVRRPRSAAARLPYRVTFVPLTAGASTVGQLRLAVAPERPDWMPEEERLVNAASEQIGRAIERARLRQEATEAELMHKTEEVRQAVLAAVSHDLRTPLASIRASAESLDQPGIQWPDEEKRDFIRVILQESDHLNRLVENLLDLGRIEAGRLRPERGWFPLEELVEDVLARLEPLTARHHVVTDIPESLPPVPLDYVQIGQVLANLGENAVRYTPPGSTIAVSARQVGDAVRVAVTDDGLGIPAAALPHVFEKFFRVSGGDRARTRGIGLGLSLARGFVEAHGGQIGVQSPPPDAGHGTVFWFTLPLHPSGDGALPAAPAAGTGGVSRANGSVAAAGTAPAHATM